MFCPNCGSPLEDQARFCNNCGTGINGAAKAGTGPSAPDGGYTQPQGSAPSSYSAQTYTGQNPYSVPNPPVYPAGGYGQPTYAPPQAAKKGSILPMILTFVFALAAAAAFYFFGTAFVGWVIAFVSLALFLVLQIVFRKKLALGILMTIIPVFITAGAFYFTTEWSGGSSLVSKGVNRGDLGNIVNGQYLFDDGTYQYYSSFDSSRAAHIYKLNKSTGTATTIFDGFGWSLVKNGDWLYFSGNAGKSIDATYNLFRIKTDGTGLQKINTGYCYGMSFSGGWLYYMKSTGYNSTYYEICRCKPDGTGEVVITNDSSGYCVVFENQLYYTNKSKILYKANTDGTNPVQLLTDEINYFIIGGGKIIYLDGSRNIKTADTSGKNAKFIRTASGAKIYKINSYKDTIFFASSDDSWNQDRYAYSYTLSSIKTDGTGEKKLYSNLSWGFYINVLGDKLYVLDYSRENSSVSLTAITKQMKLDGTGLTEMKR